MSQSSVHGRSPEYIPKIVTTFQEGYDARALGRDLIAGLSVAVVALPLSIAIAIASGATPQVGLLTVIVGGILISALGGSRTQVGGPTAAFIVVVYATILQHGFAGLLTATFMAGIILIAAALLRIGSLVRYVPGPVIMGFTAGIGILIVFSQVKDFFGLVGGDVPADFWPRLSALWAMKGTVNVQSLLIAVATVAIIMGFRRFVPKVPGLLVAAVLSALVVALFKLPVDTIHSRFGDFSFRIGMPALPDFSVAKLTELLPSALIIAFLAGIESLLSAMVADQMSGGRHRPNAEIMAQGVANCASSLFGGLPVTGAIARTATNIRAGGRTPVAGISHAMFVLLFLIVAAPLVGYLTMPTLAGTLFVTAWTMSEPARLPAAIRARWEDGLVLLLTLGLTVLSDLATAIAVGTLLGLAFRFRRREVPPPDWRTPGR